ncbi:hypothetical protein QNI16_27720 [Cytophagaceae bacterium YF14B1]|uniref:Uncharacterized protein n=1 Tax=Xanthocytophaga flava TaxID=3048013 RepID=A0AAE3QRV2_9BACT|nr:hypothetical protein [Xanthocytophaga flavus]MDJ1484317.1 hypothetical protein [Xanthocytophaga flavus]
MNIPDKLPIERIEDYHTHHLGKSRDGRLFWGYTTFVYSVPLSTIQDDNSLKFRRDYAVFHTFDRDGNYINTQYYFGGTADRCDQEELENKLDEWVSQLGETEYTDIEIKLFQTVIDGFVFGLIPDEEFSLINLEPSATISFLEPWDGGYYT